MTKKEILLKQRNAKNAPLTDYIGTDGYVWKMIENAMEEYHQDKLKLLGIAAVIKSLPDSDEIRMKAREFDEKDFDQWWWETVYKGNVL